MALGETQYYKNTVNGSTLYSAMSNAGNTPYGYTPVNKDEYVTGLQGMINSGYNAPNGADSLQKQLTDAQAGLGRYAQGYIDPSFSKYQSNAPTPSAEYLTPEAKAQYDQSMSSFNSTNAKTSQPMGPSNPTMNSVMASSSTTSPAGALPDLNNSNPQPYPTTGTAASPVTPPATGSAYPTQNLQPGMTGDAVKQLQQYLVSKGLLTQDQMNTGAGIYGPQTTAAVAALQKQLGVDTQGNSGYFGPLTQSALGKSPVSSGTPVSSPTGTSGTSAATGATGTSAGTPSGTFGPGNMTLTQAFQDYKNAQNFSPQYLADQSALMNLTGGTTVFNANAESQPISNTFISGQEAQQLKNVNAAAVPLQTRLAIDQAQRQAAIDTANTEMGLTSTAVPYGGSNTNLLTGQTNTNNNPSSDPTIAAAIANGRLTPDMVTRVGAPAILQTLSQNPNYNFITGAANKAQTIAEATNKSQMKLDANGQPIYFTPTVGGGSNTGTSSGANSSTNPTSSSSGNSYVVKSGDIFHQIALNNGMTNAQLQALNPQIADPSKITPGQKINLAPVTSSSPNTGNGIMTKADAKSLGEQQTYFDTTQRAFNTANDNLASLTAFMQTAGVNTGSTIPLINSLQNKVKAGATDPGTVAAFQAALTGLRAEYSQVLARGGVRSVSTDSEANSLIPDNLTPAQLQNVAARIKAEGQNAITEAQKQIDVIKSRSSGQPVSSASSSGTGYDAYLKAIGQ